MSTQKLQELLLAIETNYDEREIPEAKRLGYAAGIRFDSDAGTDWPVWCINLPEIGEVSWHSPAYKGKYDGYSVTEKYNRCHQYGS